MFIFTLIVSIACILLAVAGGAWSYLAFKSDDGSSESFVGSLVGCLLGGVSVALAVTGMIGLSILVTKIWG